MRGGTSTSTVTVDPGPSLTLSLILPKTLFAAKGQPEKLPALARQTRRAFIFASLLPADEFCLVTLLLLFLGSRTVDWKIGSCWTAEPSRPCGNLFFFSVDTLPSSLRFVHSQSTLTEWSYRP